MSDKEAEKEEMKDESHDVEDQEQEEEEEKREEDEGQWENLADIPTNDKPVVQVIYCIPFCSGTSLGGNIISIACQIG